MMKNRSAVYRWATDPIRPLVREGLPSTEVAQQSFGRSLIGIPPSVRVSLILVLIALSAHGYEIFSSHLTIDEELAIDSDAWRAWVSQERWGMGLLNYAVISRPVGPGVSTIIGVLGFLLALLVALRNLVRSEVSLIVAVTVGIASPTLPFLLSFSTLSFGAGLAALAAVLAARAGLLVGGPSGIGVSLVLLVAAVGIYEPFLFVLPMVGVLWLTGAAVARGLSFSTVFQCLFRMAALSALGFAISQMISHAVRAVTGVAPAPYAASLLDIGGLLEAPKARLLAATHETGRVLSGSPAAFGADLWILGGMIACAFLVVAIGVLILRWRSGIAVSLGLVGILAVPFVAELATAGSVPLRSQVYIPFLVAGIVAIMLEATASWRIRPLRILLTAAAGVLGLSLMAYGNRLYLSTEIAFDRDRQAAFELDREIAKLTSGEDAGAQNLVVIGVVSYADNLPTPVAETMGASFFEWDGGNPGRVVGMLRYVTGRSMQVAEPSQSLQLLERAEGMPSWPLEGSVRRSGTTIVVKFSEPTIQQLARWCAASQSPLCDPGQ